MQDRNETLYAFFVGSYALAAAFAAHSYDMADAARDDAPASIRPTELSLEAASIRPTELSLEAATILAPKGAS